MHKKKIFYLQILFVEQKFHFKYQRLVKIDNFFSCFQNLLKCFMVYLLHFISDENWKPDSGTPTWITWEFWVKSQRELSEQQNPNNEVTVKITLHGKNVAARVRKHIEHCKVRSVRKSKHAFQKTVSKTFRVNIFLLHTLRKFLAKK